MATGARKRIHALQRAPDGSAFKKCEQCGVSVAIALFDMHECELKRVVKRIRVELEEGLNIDDDAIQKCEQCGISVAITLFDMHECELTRVVKRIRVETEEGLNIDDNSFQKCELCGVSVVIALFDMHECELKRGVKRSRVENEEGLNSDDNTFQKCEQCGVLVAITLFDMHECGIKRGVKRSRFESEEELNIDGQPRSPLCCNIDDQPRSPFCFFMENFKKTCKSEKLLEINNRCFDAWKNLSEEERYPYVIQAEKVNSAYFNILLEESNDMSEMDDEVDSAMVGKFDRRYKNTVNNGSLHLGKFKRTK